MVQSPDLDKGASFVRNPAFEDILSRISPHFWLGIEVERTGYTGIYYSQCTGFLPEVDFSGTNQ